MLIFSLKQALNFPIYLMVDHQRRDQSKNPKKSVCACERKEGREGALAEAVTCFHRLIENDSTEGLIQFLKEDNEINREYEMEMFKVQMQSQMEMQLQMINYFSGYSQGMQSQFLNSNMPSTSFQSI